MLRNEKCIKILSGKFGRYKCTWDINIEMNLK
jgi:hypothetical protein